MAGIYRGVRGWTRAYRRWVTTVRFDHPAQQIVLQDYIHAVEDAEVRLQRLERQITELLPSGVAGVARGPAVDRRTPMGGALGDMRGDVQGAQIGDQPAAS